MKAIFKVLEGPIEHESLVIRDGEILTIGREEKADVPVPDDGQMSGLHLSVNCSGDACIIEDLKSTNGTLLNGKPVTEKTAVANGDKIRCGNTQFEVQLSGAPAVKASVVPVERQTAVSDEASPDEAKPTATQPSPAAKADENGALRQVKGFIEETAADIIQRFQLKDLPLPPEPNEHPDAYASRLRDADPESALAFLSYALPKRPAIWWLTRCVRSSLQQPTEEEEKVLGLAEKWISSPTDEHRRHAMDEAQKQECETAACWAAVAAFWTHGSMAPPNVPPVLPKDEFTGKAVSGAIVMAAVAKEPEKAPQRRSVFFDLALDVASGQETWEQ
ncbi:MAG: FHA domain-containing protein [Planctomycetaceae bacterium]